MSERTKPAVLVVDDEKNVRELVRIFLENEGYEVLVAPGGREALHIAAHPHFRFDILVTDILMPYLNGRELANRICLIRPHIKVLFISAFSTEVLTFHNLCPEKVDLLRKPFRKEELINKLFDLRANSPTWKSLTSKQA